ncbi:MAG TPA: DUF3800 domain-containing protein [Armatimonadota bacterium]|nr:DUF3800 domain-containing protein [Armatimonadota bacterium]
MNHTFVVYVDESGDEGFSFGRGSSDWFVLAAVVTRKARDLQVVKLVDRARRQLGKPDKKPLHFRDLKHEQRLPYVAEIADAVASSFYYAVQRTQHGFTEDRYARMPKPVVYHREGRYLGYGLKFWPREVDDVLKGEAAFEWVGTYRS